MFKKHKFDITGKNDIIKAVKTSLDGLAANSAALLPTTMLFIEVPTNPDMKVPDLAELVKVATEYKN